MVHREKASPAGLVVASFAEAWIEIYRYEDTTPTYAVASFAEAWIEIKSINKE